jgi:hypothetical protein
MFFDQTSHSTIRNIYAFHLIFTDSQTRNQLVIFGINFMVSTYRPFLGHNIDKEFTGGVP